MTQENIITVENIVNRFGEQTIHDGVSFAIKRGEIVGILGGSGSGKSVLLKSMIGLHTPNEGEITLNGEKLNDITPAESAALFGVLFQQGALFSSQTVAENIMMPLREHTSLTDQQLQMLASLKLSMVGLPPESGTKYPSELSGGMIKRAALARALALDPEILFLDEPTAGLDPVSASAFDELILELNKSLNITVILITHDLDTLFTICDRAAVLVDKKIIIDTLPALLKANHQWIQEYFHGPRAEGARIAAKNYQEQNNNQKINTDGKR